jgi:mRNA interferase MazF
MKRGDVVIVAARGAYTGKPRPALIVQSDLFNPTHPSVTICTITTEFVDAPLFRIVLAPGARTGLKRPSQIMVDKAVGVPRDQISSVVGNIDSDTLERAGEALRRWLSL